MWIDLFILPDSSDRNVFYIFTVKISRFYCRITHSLKVLDDDTVEFVKSIEFPWNSPDLDPLGHHVEAYLNIEWPNQRVLFQLLKLLQQRIVNMFIYVASSITK